jgi:hypothetical protein
MPPKDPAQYMRDYRAARRRTPFEDDLAKDRQDPEFDKEFQKTRREIGTRVSSKKRRTDPEFTPKTFPSGYATLPGDDWVTKMTQEQRDKILESRTIHDPTKHPKREGP